MATGDRGGDRRENESGRFVEDRGDRESSADRPEGESSDEETPLESVAAGAVTFVTLGAAFGLMAIGHPFFWVAFPVGFGGAMPLAVGLARLYESRWADRRSVRGGRSETDAALANLRERYARGELDEAQFEERVERLLETESVADARDFAERERSGTRATRGDVGSEAGGSSRTDRELE